MTRCSRRASGLVLVALAAAQALLSFSCSQMKTLSRADALSPGEKAEYLVLRALNPAAGARYLDAGSAQGRQDYADWYWQNAGRSLPKSRDEYLDRARKAGEFFGGLDLLNDDRAGTYVRYGPPRRDVYSTRPVETETTRIFTNPAEVWTYDSLGYQFDFVRIGAAFELVGEMRFGPGWFPPAFELVDLGMPAPALQPDAKQVRLEMALGRLGQRGDSVEVELHYGMPGDEPMIADSSGRRLWHFDVTFVPRTGTSTRRGFWASSPAASGPAVGRESFLLPADVYSITLNATRHDGAAARSLTTGLNLVDYVRREQPVSDLLFYALVDSTFQSPQFERPDWRRVVPLVVPRVKSGESFFALYEIYNLQTDSAGSHRVRAEYQIIEQDTRRAAVIPTPARFIAGSGSTGVTVERIHTMDLNPGRYLLVSRLEDLNGTKTASAAAEFEILPRRQ